MCRSAARIITWRVLQPDGSVWTAVNNRDNAPDPKGNVDAQYVNEHPPDELAKLVTTFVNAN